MPYEATATEVCRFFKDCDIAGGPDGILLHPETNSLSWTFFQSWSKMNYQFSDAGIYFCLNDRGLPTGEAFIEMETPQVDFAMFLSPRLCHLKIRRMWTRRWTTTRR